MTPRSRRQTCNMRLLSGLMLALVFAATPARGDLLAFESGRGDHNSRGTDAWFLRYQHDIQPLWGAKSFIEFAGGSWNGDTENRTVGGSGGLRYALTTRTYFSGSVGLAYVTDRTDYLGTHQQFQLRFALGWRMERVDLALAHSHYSNGRSIFGWNGPNTGENFITLQLGYLL